MKRIVMFTVLLFGCLNLWAQESAKEVEKQETIQTGKNSLVILWSSGDEEVFYKVVFPYGLNSKQREWWDEVELLIWGPSSKLLAENKDLQEKVKKMKDIGVNLTACKWCADQYKVSDTLEELGVEVKYMGKALTDYIKSGREVLVF